MEKLKSHLGRNAGYTPVHSGDHVEDIVQSSQRDALQNSDVTREGRVDAVDNWVNNKKCLTRFRYLAFTQSLVIGLLVLFIFFSTRHRAAGSVPLGTDPGGFVPQGKEISTQQCIKELQDICCSFYQARRD